VVGPDNEGSFLDEGKRNERRKMVMGKVCMDNVDSFPFNIRVEKPCVKRPVPERKISIQPEAVERFYASFLNFFSNGPFVEFEWGFPIRKDDVDPFIPQCFAKG
jgi:hypothetical protein